MSHKTSARWQNRRRVKNYALRGIPPELWRRVKAKAAYDDRTVRSVLLELLRLYAEHGWDMVEKIDGKE